MTDESEVVLERYNYSAFGTLLGSPTLLTPFLWGGMVGYYWDAALATQYIRARHYQPTIARWISLDPIGFAGGDANLFRYVGNSPTSGSGERRVGLSASAKGLPYIIVSDSVLSRLSTRMDYFHKSSFLAHDQITTSDEAIVNRRLFRSRSLDPTGLAAVIFPNRPDPDAPPANDSFPLPFPLARIIHDFAERHASGAYW